MSAYDHHATPETPACEVDLDAQHDSGRGGGRGPRRSSPSSNVVSYDRSPVALLRLVASSVSIAIVVALTELLPRTHRGLEADLRSHTGSWGDALASLADSAAGAWALVIVVSALVAALLAHRARQACSVVVAALLGALVVDVAARVGGITPGRVTAEEWVLSAVVAGLAVLTVSFSALAPPLSRRSAIGITLLTLVGAVGADVSLGTRVTALLSAVFIGAAVALIIGTPSLGVSDEQLCEGLERAKLPVDHLEPHPGDARGSFPWVAELATGRRVFVKVQVADQHSADVLFRMWRRLRLRGAGDERAPATLRRAAEHEAFVAQRAAMIGVRTPTVLALGMLAEDRGCFTVFESIDGATFADVGECLTDATLRGAWSQIQVMQRGGIAHRDLRAANLLVAAGDDDQPWVIDFGFAEVAAPERLLHVDLVEFLASSAALVGADRAVDNAVAVMGLERAGTALPFVQPLAVSSATRAELTRREFTDLREKLRAAVGAPAPDIPQLQRIRPKTVLATLGLAVAVWVLLPQVTDGLDVSRVFRADAQWVAVAVAASVVTYVGAALALAGSVLEPVPFRGTFLAQVASSFTNRITPARVEGMALNVRYLSKQGIDDTVAATAVAVSTAAGAVVHVVLALIAVLWAGNVGFGKLEPPSARTFGVTGAIVVLAVGATFVVPPVRRWFFDATIPLLRRSIRAFVEVVRQPRNLLRLAGGSVLVTIANIVALDASLRAFGPAPPLATVAVVYLAASAVAAAAPTPGGLGATEAALVAGLSVTGAAGSSAVPAVLLFRAATFWLPILPGWLSFLYLQRNDEL